MTNQRVLSVVLACWVGCVPFAILPAQEWYASSAGGVPDAPLSGVSLEGWCLSLERTDTREVRSLYLDGLLQGKMVFLRENGRLIARIEEDAEGQILCRVEYAYDAQGQPRMIVMESDSLQIIADQEQTADQAHRRISTGSGEDWMVTDMDFRHRPLRQVSIHDQDVEEEVSWLRDEAGNLREEIRLKGYQTTRRLFNDDGRIAEERILRDSDVVLVRYYSWAGSDLIRVEERGEGRYAVREIEWQDGRIAQETFREDGQVVRHVQWDGPHQKTETLYRNGEEVVRVYWVDHVRIREEFLRNGEVIRLRES